LNEKSFTHWKKNAAFFLSGQGLSMLGSMLVQYAIMWHVTLSTQSGSAMTLFAVAAVLPMFFISPFGGVWADRYNKKYLINISDTVIAVVTLIMAIMFFFGINHIGLLFICSVVRGLGQGVQTPAVNALLPQIVPNDKLTRINGINGSIQSLCMLAAPMLSGVILTFAAIEVVMMIDVFTAVIGISVVFFFVKTPPKAAVTTHTIGADKNGYFRDMKQGLLYIKKHKFITEFMIFAAAINMMAAPASMLTPLQTTRNFGGDEWRLAAIEIAFSAGMILGGVIISAWGGFKNRTLSLAVAIVCLGAETIFFGLLGNFWLYIACMAVTGVTMPFFTTPMMSIFQTKVEPEYTGRVFGVFSMISSLMMPLGMVVFGPLGDVVSLNYIFMGTGAMILLLGFVLGGNKTLMQAGKP
jgi:DHA3 family macrolide efflux protein-like MFS transporter